MRFSALQRAENSSMLFSLKSRSATARVSVLFSEPKIPQSSHFRADFLIIPRFQCSSASRKFLNICPPSVVTEQTAVSVLFSEPKIPQYQRTDTTPRLTRGFSALQRAENSSMYVGGSSDYATVTMFQCSSASRKFLNLLSSASINVRRSVSVLFSEPKIPQWDIYHCPPDALDVSVLFSEPKIPQSPRLRPTAARRARFQCSSASRKFLNDRRSEKFKHRRGGFSALQRAENSSIRRSSLLLLPEPRVSVLFSEPKIPQ